MYLSILEDYSDTPGLRYRTESEYSGEAFREDLLEAKYCEAFSRGEKLEIDFDGTFGYATSFLEEAFGGLAEKHGVENVKRTLVFISNEDISIIGKTLGYIENAINRKKKKI